MNRDEVALRIFCSFLSTGGKVDLYEKLGENQIRVAFTLADTFLGIAVETRRPPAPSLANPRHTLNTIPRG